MTRKTTSADKRTQEPEENRRKKKLYDISFFHSWCKQCGLCMTFCPKHIIHADKTGRPHIEDADRCTGCRFCEIHCPDFAITVKERVPRRRKTDE